MTQVPAAVLRCRPGLAAAIALALAVAPAGVAAEEPAAPKAAAVDLATVSTGLTADQQAELRFLEHLGWTFARDPAATTVAVHGGTPCYRRDVESMKAGGDLHIALPPQIADAAAFGATVTGLADSVATRCAFKQKVAVAAREATRKLAAIQESGEYTFPKLLIVDSPWFRCTLPEPEWKKAGVENFCRSTPSRAIEAVYTRGGVAECYTAQWVAIFAMQYELYGPAWFDQVFTKEELRLGRPTEQYQTAIGQYVDESKPTRWRSLLITEAEANEDPGLVLARHGPKAFAGLTGVLQNDREEIGANQNLTIVSVSPRAVEELKARGGMRRVVELSTEAVEVRTQGRKIYSASEREGYRVRREQIYADPVLSEILVYIHPLGVSPLAKAVEKEVGEHGRPVKLRIYTNALDDFLYQRYRSAWKQRWLRDNAASLAPQPTPPPAAAPPAAGDAIPAPLPPSEPVRPPVTEPPPIVPPPTDSPPPASTPTR